MIASNTKRPRNVDVPRAAAILYGDWGTSKAYVLGLAFAAAGYCSFWLLLPMCLLTALVGVNYMAICKHYPDGGGVYASVRHRSEIISIVGAFLLIADYLVTAAISALSACQYLHLPHPELFAALGIAIIGSLNYFGPKHTGGLAFLISVPTVIVVIGLGIFSLPHLGEAVHNIQPLTGGFWKNWSGFVGIVLALSGVEAVANSTGVMRLNPGTTDGKPCVSKTSTPAILWVMIEVCVFTALLGLAMNALPDLVINKDNVDAPGNPGVRDSMLSYMGQVFVGGSWGTAAGHWAAWIVSIVFGCLLFSAVNTAIVDLIAISFLMSRDGEIPPQFQRLNKFGVPNPGILVATLIPIALVIFVKDVDGLAALYAVGVVGAIATNLGASATDKKLDLARWERWLMSITFVIMLSIELSLFWDKPHAAFFAAVVLVIGLILRGIAAEQARKKTLAAEIAKTIEGTPSNNLQTSFFTKSDTLASGSPMMCAVRGLGKTLDFAIEEARASNRPLYLLFVRMVPVLSEADQKRKWPDDDEAREIFLLARKKAEGYPLFPCYAVSDSVADTIVDITATVGASHLIIGASERKGLAHLLRGSIIREISDSLPDEIHLLVYA